MMPILSDPIPWPTLSRLLDEALALPPEPRHAWRAGLVGLDPGLGTALRELPATQARIETDSFLQALPTLASEARRTNSRLAQLWVRIGCLTGWAKAACVG